MLKLNIANFESLDLTRKYIVETYPDAEFHFMNQSNYTNINSVKL